MSQQAKYKANNNASTMTNDKCPFTSGLGSQEETVDQE